MIDLHITFTEHGGALRFRAEADPSKSTPLENATARLVALFLEREMNLFFATAQRALSRGVVVAPDPESNSAKDPQVLPSAEAAPADRPATTPPSSLETGVFTPKDAPVDLPPDPPATPAPTAPAPPSEQPSAIPTRLGDVRRDAKVLVVPDQAPPATAVAPLPPPEIFEQPGD